MSEQLTRALQSLLAGEGCDPMLQDDKLIHALRLMRFVPDEPLTERQQALLDAVFADAFRACGDCAVRCGEDEIIVLLAHTAFPAHLHRVTALWLCLCQFSEACSLELELEGTLLAGGEFTDPLNWQAHLSPMHDASEWWSLVSPTDGSTAHRHRAALQTIVKRRQYPSIPGYVTRAMHTAKDPSALCFGFVPLVIEAVWSQHASLPLSMLTEGLDLAEMTRRPREALLAWLTGLAARLRACPQVPEEAPIERVVAAIRADCSLPYTQANISRSLGLTPAYFCRLFREKTGQHFSTFLTDARMARAKELMRQGDLSLQELSEQCGYPNKSYFCQVFKKATGMTPGEFEQQALLEKLTNA